MRVGISSATYRWLLLQQATDHRIAVHVDDDGIALERDGTRIRWSELRSVTLDKSCELVDDAGRWLWLSRAHDHFLEIVTHAFRHAAHRHRVGATLPHVLHLPTRTAQAVFDVLLGVAGLIAAAILIADHAYPSGGALGLASLVGTAWTFSRRLVRIEIDHGKIEVVDAWGRRVPVSAAEPLFLFARGQSLFDLTPAHVELFAHALLCRGEVLAQPPPLALPSLPLAKENGRLLRTFVLGAVPFVSMGLLAWLIHPEPDPTRLLGEEIAAAIAATPTDADRVVAVLIAVAAGIATVSARGAIRWRAVALGASLGLAITMALVVMPVAVLGDRERSAP